MNNATTIGGKEYPVWDLRAMPVYSIIEGELLGSIDSLCINHQERCVALIRVGRSESEGHAYVRFSAFRKIGPKVALVDSEAALRERAAIKEVDDRASDLAGCPVITCSGKNIGCVLGFGIEGISGKIIYVRVEWGGDFLTRLMGLNDRIVDVPDEFVRSFGPDAVIVSDDVQNLLE